MPCREKLINEIECSPNQEQESNPEATVPPVSGGDSLVKTLERTEAELFEVKSELKIKVCCTTAYVMLNDLCTSVND